MPLRLALGVRGTVAGHRLGALESGGGGASPPSNASLGPYSGGVRPSYYIPAPPSLGSEPSSHGPRTTAIRPRGHTDVDGGHGDRRLAVLQEGEEGLQRPQSGGLDGHAAVLGLNALQDLVHVDGVLQLLDLFLGGIL